MTGSQQGQSHVGRGLPAPRASGGGKGGRQSTLSPPISPSDAVKQVARMRLQVDRNPHRPWHRFDWCNIGKANQCGEREPLIRRDGELRCAAGAP